MSLCDLVERAALFTEERVLARLDARLRLAKTVQESPFFFGRFAEHRALHLILSGEIVGSTLRDVNGVRNKLLERCSGVPPDSLYALACDQRLSGQTLFCLLSHLGVPNLVAYARRYHSTEEEPRFAVVLEQGGCRVHVGIKRRQIVELVKGRRQESASQEN